MRCRRFLALALALWACWTADEVLARRIKQTVDDAVVSASEGGAVVPVVAAIEPLAVPGDAVASQAPAGPTEALDVPEAVSEPDSSLVEAPVAVEPAGDLGTTAEVEPEVSAAAVTSSNYDVIVIGAGLAGLKAAFDLQARGYSVALLEGRDRVGGRVFSTRLASSTGVQATYPVEVGAQWFHGSAVNNPVHQLAVSNLSLTPITSGNSGGLYNSTSVKEIPSTDYTNFQTLYDGFAPWVRAKETSTTTTVSSKYKNPSFSLASAVSAYVAEKGLSVYQQRGLAHFINTEIEQEFGASASWLSSFLYNEGSNINGGDFVMPAVNSVVQNLTQIPTLLASKLPAGSVKLSHNVTNIAYNTTGVTVTAVAAGTTVKFYAKAAIVAVPLGLLKKRGTSFFSPALDTAKQNAINRLGMSLLNKVILEFPTTYAGLGPFEWGWWHNRLPNATNDSGDWQEFFVLKRAYNTITAVPPVLVAFQAGQPAVNAETTMTDAQAVASVMTQLKRWWPDMPEPSKTLVTRWWTDPWTYGSYSYASTSCTGTKNYPTERTAFLPSSSNLQSNRVWFAGEHTSVAYPATMQGAYLSGEAAAKAVAAKYPRA